jgi:hypothetical protein
MSSASRYRCPACGFQIFNRRIAKCESCGGVLPTSLLFTAQQIAALDAEHDRNRKTRETRARSERENSTSYGGDVSFGGDDGGGCD